MGETYGYWPRWLVTLSGVLLNTQRIPHDSRSYHCCLRQEANFLYHQPWWCPFRDRWWYHSTWQTTWATATATGSVALRDRRAATSSSTSGSRQRPPTSRATARPRGRWGPPHGGPFSWVNSLRGTEMGRRYVDGCSRCSLFAISCFGAPPPTPPSGPGPPWHGYRANGNHHQDPSPRIRCDSESRLPRCEAV